MLAISVLSACGQRIEIITTSPNLKLSVSSCKGQWARHSGPPLKQVKWIDELTLRVTAQGAMQCEVDRVSAAYAISRSNLELGFIASSPAAAAAEKKPPCECLRELEFVITNLDKGNYIVVIEDIPRDGTAKKWQSRQLK